MHRFLFLLLALAGACSSSNSTCIDPDGFDRDADDCDPGIYVSGGSDSWDAEWLGDNSTLSDSFSWTNPSGGAEVSIDMRQATAGSANVVIEDADGEVISDNTVEAGVGRPELDTSASGAPGTWTIRIEVEGFSGAGDVSLSSFGD